MQRTLLKAEGNDRERTSRLRLQVAAGNWTGAALHGLPLGGSLRIEAESDGPLRLLLADAAGHENFPGPIDALFDRQIEVSMVAEITLPRSEDYVLIADNRSGTAPRDVLLALRGRAQDAGPPLPLPDQFKVLQTQLDAAFHLDGLTLRLDDPGPPRPQVIGRELVVGQAFITRLGAEPPDAETSRGAILFAIMYALANGLFLRAGPASVAPEHLAAALMILFNQIGSARRQAAYFAAEGAAPPALPDSDGGNDPFAPETARAVLRQLKDPQALLTAMQDILLARMRPATLDRLLRESPAWADPRRVAAARAALDRKA